jgi:DNA-binding GntR family transcriptional regulator
MSRTMIAIVGPVPDLDRSAPVPLWVQLRDRLADDITSGRLTGQIPSAAALAAAYGVSKPTAEKALRALGAAGLTVGVPGKGTFVKRGEQ